MYFYDNKFMAASCNALKLNHRIMHTATRKNHWMSWRNVNEKKDDTTLQSFSLVVDSKNIINMKCSIYLQLS
jgi:hypothetical protein